MNKTTTVVMVMVLVSRVLAGQVKAAPIASDGFDYPEGNLAGNNGGSGWSNAWHDVYPAGTPKSFVLTPSLEYTDSKGAKLAATGNQVGIAYDALRCPDLNIAKRTDLAAFVKDGKLGADDTTIWISFIAHCGGGANWSLVDLYVGTEERVQLGHAGGATAWGFIDATGNKTGKTPVTKDVFYVVRIDFKKGDDAMCLWTNPDLDKEPAVENADVKGRKDASFDTVIIRGDCKDEVYVDELRIGTTWNDVCAIKK